MIPARTPRAFEFFLAFKTTTHRIVVLQLTLVIAEESGRAMKVRPNHSNQGLMQEFANVQTHSCDWRRLRRHVKRAGFGPAAR